MNRAAAAILFLILGWAVPATTARSQDIVSVRATEENRIKLARTPLDRLMEWDHKIYLVLAPGDLPRLRSLGVPFAFETARLAPPPPPGAASQGGLNGAYHSYVELEQDLLSIERAYPAIARLSRLGTTLEGRTIYALKISDHPDRDEDEPEVLFLGCHHAREWISVEVPLLLAHFLTGEYRTNETARKLVDSAEIWIIPLVNPDGLEYSIQTYRWWRKNRRFNVDGSFGVDLNRNYGYMWGVDNEGSSPDPSSDVFRGREPFSEPETRIIRGLCEARDFRVVVSYHSYSQLILYAWGWTTLPAPKAAEYAALAGRMAELIRPVNGRDYTPEAASLLYLTNGDTVDFASGTLGIPAFTIELPPLDFVHGGFMNAENDIQTVFAENLPAMLFLIDDACQKYQASGNGEKPNRPPQPKKGKLDGPK
jgi:carboxypeptidase T